MTDEKKGPKTRHRWIVRVAIVVILCCSLFGGCAFMSEKLNIPEDNVVEELVEGYIEHETGVSLDLTPKSPE